MKHWEPRGGSIDTGSRADYDRAPHSDPTPGEASLATHKSARKRIRQTEKRRVRNQAVRSKTRTVVKKFRQALAAGEIETATARFRDAERALRKAASKGVLPKTRASRHVGRLARNLASLTRS